MNALIAKTRMKLGRAPRGTRRSAEKIGLFDRLFGCWHRNLSRPFTCDGVSYCVCLDCGARKDFDAVTLQTFGSFYYPRVQLQKHDAR